MSNLTDVPDKEAEAPERELEGASDWPVNRVWLPDGVINLAAVSPELHNVAGDWWIRTSHAIALISAKREEYQRISDNWNNLVANRASAGSKADACVELLALLTGDSGGGK